MATWSDDELERIGKAPEIRIVTRRRDGTSRRPVTIWVVRVGDDLFVRAVRGRFGGWFQGTRDRHDGQILVSGALYEVTFEPADPALNDDIDKAYRTKYRAKSPAHVTPIVAPAAREATLRLIPVGNT